MKKKKKFDDNWNTRNFYIKTLRIGVFKSRTFSLISRIPNERTSIWKLDTKHERRKQGWREEARATSKTNRGGRVNARKGEYKGIRHGYCKSPGETRNLSIPCFFFWPHVATWVASYTVRIFYSKRSIRFPHIYFVRGRSAYRCGNRDVLNSSTYPIQSRCRSFSPVSSAPESTSI